MPSGVDAASCACKLEELCALMECPNCGESSRSKFRISSGRISHSLARTRKRECLTCGESSFSVEIPIEKWHVTCHKHYHVREDVLRHLIKSLHDYEQG
jgi:transcriptional regulator NrdR family protein